PLRDALPIWLVLGRADAPRRAFGVVDATELVLEERGATAVGELVEVSSGRRRRRAEHVLDAFEEGLVALRVCRAGLRLVVRPRLVVRLVAEAPKRARRAGRGERFGGLGDVVVVVCRLQDKIVGYGKEHHTHSETML